MLMPRVQEHVCSGGVVLLWIMILLPATLLFVSVGAWIPAVGCVACVIAIHNRVDDGRAQSKSLSMQVSNSYSKSYTTQHTLAPFLPLSALPLSAMRLGWAQ